MTGPLLPLPDADALQALLEDAIARHRVPGAALGVLSGSDRVVVSAGVAHAGTGLAAATDTVFRVASVTKLFVATLVHQALVELGADVHTPAADLVPELAGHAHLRDVTVADLLGHTSGIESDCFDDFGAGADAIARYVAAVPGLGTVTPRGSLHSYCNSGYVVLGRLLEHWSGMPFVPTVKRRLLKPLGLQHTSLLAEDAITERVAVGHDLDRDGRPQVRRPWTIGLATSPTGGVASTADDVLTLLQAHLEGHEALAPEGLRRMRLHHVDCGEPWSVGPGWALGFTECAPGGTLLGHDGLLIGFGAYARISFDRRYAFVLLTNAGHGRTVWQELQPSLLAPLGTTPDVLPPPSGRPAPHTDRYVGTYRRLGMDAAVTAGPDGLLLTQTPTGAIALVASPSTVPLHHVRGDLFSVRAATGVDVPVLFVDEPGDPDGVAPARYLSTGARMARRVAG